MSNQNKPLVIYHANCLDGFAAAWSFWRVFGTQMDYLAASYQDAPPDVTNRVVYLVDFSYQASIVKTMLEQAELILFIDHHDSAIRDLAQIGDVKFVRYISADNSQSGAGLAWRYLSRRNDINPGAMPKILKHIEDRDLWRFQYPETKAICAFIASHDYDFGIWDKIITDDFCELHDYKKQGEALLRQREKELGRILSDSLRYAVIADYLVPVANVPYAYASDAGDRLNRKEVFSATYYDSAHYRHFSLRSRPDGQDVSVIAKQFGGGGHVRAAGFKVPRNHPLAQI